MVVKPVTVKLLPTSTEEFSDTSPATSKPPFTLTSDRAVTFPVNSEVVPTLNWSSVAKSLVVRVALVVKPVTVKLLPTSTEEFSDTSPATFKVLLALIS